MDWQVLILAFLLPNFANCHDPWKSSLVFVIDDTGSMASVINQVRSYADQILNTVINTKASQIENYVLITFNDHDRDAFKKNNAIKRIVTSNHHQFKAALATIQVYGGWDCPEYSLTGIELALQESLPRSYVYVFTDAAAKDYQKYEIVKNLALKKSSQISFILTGNLCKTSIQPPPPRSYIVYDLLAKATSGQVFKPTGLDITQILNFVREAMKGRMGELAKQSFPRGPNHKLIYPKEDFTDDVFIFVAGLLLSIHVTDPEGMRSHTTDLVKTDNNRVVKVESNKTGIFVVTLNSGSNVDVTVQGRTSIDFQYGFKLPSSKTKTTVKPTPDQENHLHVSLNVIQGGDVKLTKVQLLDLNGKVLIEKPLKEVDKGTRTYVTDPFVPPKQMFRVMIIGYVVGNNNPVKRLSSTPTEPESARAIIVPDKDKTIYTGSEGDKDLRIPCRATGYPVPTITWQVNGQPVLPGPKYSIDDGTLVVHSPLLSDTRDYICVATNSVGGDRKTFKGIVQQRPRIELDPSKTTYTALEGGEDLRIPCRAVGSPTPSITWEVDGKPIQSGPKYSIEGGTLVVHSPLVSDTRDYTCVATNSVGGDRKTFKGIVHLRPKIVLDPSKTTYTALEGDEVLRIPCRAVGSPTPSITWEVDGKPVVSGIKSGSRYSIDHGTLVVHSPRVSDTRDYTCVATNSVGGDRKTFKGIVQQEITSFDNVHKIYVKKGTTYHLECLVPHTDTDTVRWFEHQEGANNTGTTTLTLMDQNISENGNYSCRVSNENGYKMDTYEVSFGYAPTFEGHQDERIDWTGEGNMDCTVKAEPLPTIQWYHDGKLMKTAEGEMRKDIPGWGHYSCNVSNVHGSIQRNFIISSTDCLIHKTEEEYSRHPPIIVSENGIWFNGMTSKNFHIIPSQEKVILSCQNQTLEANAFKTLPGINEIQATCVGENKFLINGKKYQYSDLQCARAIDPIVIRIGEKCLNDNTEMVKVGYQLKEFTEVYRVCMDLTHKQPLYSRVMNVKDVELSVSMPWRTVPAFEPRQHNYEKSCKTPTDTCCLNKEQLVKANEVAYGAAQRSTFINNVNTALLWRGCKESRYDWNGLVDKLSFYDKVGVWSGASQYNVLDEAVIPKYLWKVVKTSDSGSMAFIYVNKMEPQESDVLCNNLCLPGNPSESSWIESDDKYMYCCQFNDFIKAFQIPENVFAI